MRALTDDEREQPASRGDIEDAVSELALATDTSQRVLEKSLDRIDDHLTAMVTKVELEQQLTAVKDEIVRSVRESIGNLQDRVADLEAGSRF